MRPTPRCWPLPVGPQRRWRNLRRLAARGPRGPYGFYEAIDYTPSAGPRGRGGGRRRRATWPTTRACAWWPWPTACWTNRCRGASTPSRWSGPPSCCCRSACPRGAAGAAARATEQALPRDARRRRRAGAAQPRIDHAGHAHPAHAPALERRYTVHGHQRRRRATAAGGPGRDALARGRHPRPLGRSSVYVRDLDSGDVWSARHQPRAPRRPTSYEVSSPSTRPSSGAATAASRPTLEITVSPEDDAEVRRVTLTNHDSRPRDIGVTSYAEVVLAPHGGGRGPPGLQQALPGDRVRAGGERAAVPARGRARRADRRSGRSTSWPRRRRRPRRPACSTRPTGPASWAGAARTADPAALDGRPLSSTDRAGPRPDLQPAPARATRAGRDAPASTFTTGVGRVARGGAARWPTSTTTSAASSRAFELAWAHSQVELRHLHLRRRGAPATSGWPGAPALRRAPALRAAPRVLAPNRQGQSGLWAYGISGDLPILLVTIGEARTSTLVRAGLLAHTLLAAARAWRSTW